MNFTLMKIKVGQVVKNQITRSSIPKTKIAEKIGISRTWLTQILESEEMEQEYIVKIGKCIKYDFSKNFPQLNSMLFEQQDYNDGNLTDCKKRLQEVTDKYVILLEKYTEMVELLNKSK